MKQGVFGTWLVRLKVGIPSYLCPACSSLQQATVREYLYAEQVAALTPWSEDALDRLIRRGTLRAGLHFFQPTGHRGRRIFKWSALVRLIEGHDSERVLVVRTKVRAKGFDVAKAEESLRRLLG